MGVIYTCLPSLQFHGARIPAIPIGGFCLNALMLSRITILPYVSATVLNWNVFNTPQNRYSKTYYVRYKLLV